MSVEVAVHETTEVTARMYPESDVPAFSVVRLHSGISDVTIFFDQCSPLVLSTPYALAAAIVTAARAAGIPEPAAQPAPTPEVHP